MKAGIIKVIVTMNFDRLFEQALGEIGVQPTIVATEADAEGLGPLRLLTACVIHLHGDYLNPASMLNTDAELSGYSPHMQRLLHQVLDDYGLLVAGWSVQHDVALREAAVAHCSRRFTMGWIEPGATSSAADQLIAAKSAIVFEASADTAFGLLGDQVTAISEKQARHPLTVTVMASRVKRQLSGQHPAIGAHDVLAAELTRLQELPELWPADLYDVSGFEQILGRVVEATRVPAAAVSVLSYWGSPDTDLWWTSDVQRLARPPRRNGSAWLINLPVVAATMLFYAGSVAAVAARNYGRLVRLFNLEGEPVGGGGPTPLVTMLAPSEHHMGWVPARLHTALAPLLCESLGVGIEAIDEAWQRFEIVRLTSVLMAGGKAESALDEYNRVSTASADSIFTDRDVREIAEDKRSVLDGLTAHCRPGGLHLLAADQTHVAQEEGRWGSPAAERLLAEIRRERQAHPLVSAWNAQPDTVELALRAVSAAVGRWGDSHPGDPRTGSLPDEVWLDRSS